MSGSGRKGARKRFVVDTNVFVAAIKPFSRHSRPAPADTSSLALLIRLITDTDLELFGNLWLLDEYRRLEQELNSETSALILGQLTAKMQEVTEIKDEALARCRPHLPERETADVLHAAMCLQSGAVLITNDRDFDRIKDSETIEVWSIREAIRMLSVWK